jgi:hypothetical protein
MIYQHLERSENPNLYDRLNVSGVETFKVDDDTIIKVRRIIGSLVGVDVSNMKKGFGIKRIYQLR